VVVLNENKTVEFKEFLLDSCAYGGLVNTKKNTTIVGLVFKGHEMDFQNWDKIKYPIRTDTL